MSIARRQHTCAACGGTLGTDVELEVLIDDVVRWVAVHRDHSTAPVPAGAVSEAVVVRGPWGRPADPEHEARRAA